MNRAATTSESAQASTDKVAPVVFNLETGEAEATPVPLQQVAEEAEE